MEKQVINPRTFIAESKLEADRKSSATFFLDQKELILRKSEKELHFPLADIQSIQLKEKIMLFPALAGGIITPMTLIALFNGVGQPSFMILIAFLGIISLYFGLSGQTSVEITCGQQQYDYFAYNPSPELQHFISLTSNLIQCGSFENLFQLRLNHEEYNKFKLDGVLKAKTGIDLHINNQEPVPPHIHILHIRDIIFKPLLLIFRKEDDHQPTVLIMSDLPFSWVSE